MLGLINGDYIKDIVLCNDIEYIILSKDEILTKDKNDLFRLSFKEKTLEASISSKIGYWRLKQQIEEYSRFCDKKEIKEDNLYNILKDSKTYLNINDEPFALDYKRKENNMIIIGNSNIRKHGINQGISKANQAGYRRDRKIFYLPEENIEFKFEKIKDKNLYSKKEKIETKNISEIKKFSPFSEKYKEDKLPKTKKIFIFPQQMPYIQEKTKDKEKKEKYLKKDRFEDNIYSRSFDILYSRLKKDKLSSLLDKKNLSLLSKNMNLPEKTIIWGIKEVEKRLYKDTEKSFKDLLDTA